MKIYQSIKDLVTKERVTKAAATLGEKETNVASAISYILPSMLGAMCTKGATPAIKSDIELAGKHNLRKDLNAIFEGSGVIDGMNIGERFENALLGAKNNEFPKAIANKSGVKVESADRLGNWVAATIAAWFGDMSVKQKVSLGTLMEDLGREKGEIVRDIPEDIARQLNIIVPGAAKVDNKKTAVAVKEKKGMGWIWWVIIILAILIIAFLIFRSCDTREERARLKAETEKVETAVDNAANSVKNEANKLATDLKEFTLSNGQKIMARENSMEAKMIEFLNSAEYRNGTNEQLKSKWFHFDHIDFEHDSTTEMTPGSRTQLDNIAHILKAYPAAKIRIGGYADKTGSVAVNDEISKERAEFVKSVFVKNGISAARVSTEGFGKEFATHPAGAPDSERALDRHIALRFEK